MPADAPPPPPRRTRHRAIFEALQKEIATGAFAADGRLPTEQELTRRFRASRPTVARALNDLRGQGLIDRRPGAGTFLRSANPLHGGLIGLIGAGLGHTEILGPIGDEIARAARLARYHLLLGDAGGGERQADALGREFRARGVAGVVMAPLESLAGREAANRHIAAALAAAGIPVVLIDRDLLDFPARSALDLVAVDDVRAGCRLAAHLLERGCRRLGFVARPSPPSTTDLRIAGCRVAVAACPGAGLAVHLGDPDSPAFAGELLRRPACDGLICANDRTAAQLMRTLAAAGVRVPQQVRVAGFDDVRDAAGLPVPLTTMRLPCRELGAMAVRTLLERIREPDLPARLITLDARLVVRRSTAR